MISDFADAKHCICISIYHSCWTTDELGWRLILWKRSICDMDFGRYTLSVENSDIVLIDNNAVEWTNLWLHFTSSRERSIRIHPWWRWKTMLQCYSCTHIQLEQGWSQAEWKYSNSDIIQIRPTLSYHYIQPPRVIWIVNCAFIVWSGWRERSRL